MSRVRTIIKRKKKEKTIGIINKEVDSIEHRSILNDEPVRDFIEPMKKHCRSYFFFFVYLRIDEYININNRCIYT